MFWQWILYLHITHARIYPSCYKSCFSFIFLCHSEKEDRNLNVIFSSIMSFVRRTVKSFVSSGYVPNINRSWAYSASTEGEDAQRLNRSKSTLLKLYSPIFAISCIFHLSWAKLWCSLGPSLRMISSKNGQVFFATTASWISSTAKLVIWSVRGMRLDAQMAAENGREEKGKRNGNKTFSWLNQLDRKSLTQTCQKNLAQYRLRS